MKKEKEKEPEKTEKQETAMVWKKGFVEEKKDDNDSDEVDICRAAAPLERKRHANALLSSLPRRKSDQTFLRCRRRS